MKKSLFARSRWRLVKVKSRFAPHLKRAIDTSQEKEAEQFHGVAHKPK
jgi:hypothetical protein